MNWQSAAIERVQRRATKLVPEIKDMPYTGRLRALSLISLKARRVRGDLIQTYKIINNVDDTKVSNFFKFSSTTCTRNSIDKLCVNYSRTNIRKFSFSNRVPPVWNKLPELVKKAPNVNTFKNAIDRQKVLVDIFYEFDE